MPRLSMIMKGQLLYKKGTLPVLFVLALLVPVFCIRMEAQAYLFMLNFSVIAIIITAFAFGQAASYILSGLVTVLTLLSMFAHKGFELPYFASAMFLNLVPFIPSSINRKYYDYLISKNLSLSSSKASYEKLADDSKALKGLNTSLQNQAHDILDLYEMTKKMSASLEAVEVLKIFRDAINKISRSVVANVVLIDGSSPRITYVVHNPSSEGAVPEEIKSGAPGKFETILAESVCAKGKMISFKPSEDKSHPFAQYVGDVPGSFIALPLFSEGVPIGVLTIAGANDKHVESFNILAEQLALELKKINLYDRIQELAITDGLTGIYVRRHFIERLNEEIERLRRHSLKLSMLMIDLDHFKQCNDTYGHLVGDIVLKEIAKIMKEYVRQVDLIGRYGGEEFVIALPDTDRSSALNVADRIRMSVEKHKFRAYDETISMTISIGIAVFPENGSDTATLIDHADQALYKAKEGGRNRVIFWP